MIIVLYALSKIQCTSDSYVIIEHIDTFKITNLIKGEQMMAFLFQFIYSVLTVPPNLSNEL